MNTQELALGMLLPVQYDAANQEEVLLTAGVTEENQSVQVPNEMRTDSPAHFNWHLKVKVGEVKDDVGTAPHSARNVWSQEDDTHISAEASGDIMESNIDSHLCKSPSGAFEQVKVDNFKTVWRCFSECWWS